MGVPLMNDYVSRRFWFFLIVALVVVGLCLYQLPWKGILFMLALYGSALANYLFGN